MGFLDDILGNTARDTANKAAADTYGKQQGAITGLTNYAGTVPGQYNKVASGYDPYANAGGGALQQLMSGLGLNGAGGSQDFTNAYHALPGYQAGLDTGTNAVLKGANAGHMLQSGRTMKTLQRFGQDYEDQKSGDYLSRLTGVANAGQAATGARAGLQGQGIGTEAGLQQAGFGGQMNAAGTIGQGMVAGEQAHQNALTNLMQTGTALAGMAAGMPPTGLMGGPKMAPSPNGPNTYSPMFGSSGSSGGLGSLFSGWFGK